MDGSKSANRVGLEISIFIDKHLTMQLKYKVVERCSNNQAEQFAITKVLEKMKDLYHLKRNQ
jgi:ribonuclease HI